MNRISDKISRVRKSPSVSVIAVYLMLSVPGASFAAIPLCTDLENLTEAQLVLKECPSGFCTTSQQGAITNHLLQGDCAPVAPFMYKGATAGTQAPDVSNIFSHTAPSTATGGVLQPEVAIITNNNSANSSSPPDYSSTLNADGTTKAPGSTVNPNLNQPGTCTPASGGSIPALPCGGAVPLLNSFTQTNPQNGGVTQTVSSATPSATTGTSIGSMLSLGSNISIGTPSPLTPVTAVSAVTNLLAQGTCAPSTLQLPNNAISLILPATTAATPVTASTITYQSTAGVVNLPGMDSVELALSQPGLVTLPQGGQFTLPNGNEFYLNPGAVVISYGNGTVVLPMEGAVPPVVPVGQVLPNPENYQQSLTIPGNLVPTFNNMAQGILPQYALRDNQNYQPEIAPPDSGNTTTDQPSNYAISAAVKPANTGYPQLVGYYLNYASTAQPLVINTTAVKSYTVDPSNGTTTVANVNSTIATSTIAAPSGAVLSVPLGSPITFALNQPGSISLPAGGSIQVPVGSIVNGNVVAIATAVPIPQNNVLTSNGSGGVTFTNGTTITFPSGTSSASIAATMVGVPAGTSLPVSPGSSVVTPQTPGQPVQQTAC